MRQGNLLPGKPNWYDRNPSANFKTYWVAAGGPHSTTIRWTYTVPTNKKTLVDAVSTYVRRASAATSASFVGVIIEIDPTGGSFEMICVSFMNGNVIDGGMNAEFGQAGTLNPGSVIQCRTFDSSTGGQINMLGAAKLTTFDAQ